MTKISHEIPKELFPIHSFVNDYPYLLGHLLKQDSGHYDKEYAEFYKQTVGSYDYSILDNGAFELGDSIDPNWLYEVGEEYKPTHLIIPDALHNSNLTRERCIKYLADFGSKSTPKFIAVLQGNSLEELFSLYSFYKEIPQIDIIALPFDFFTKELANTDAEINGKYPYATEDEKYKLQRLVLVDKLVAKFGQWNSESKCLVLPKKLHLLGCATPNEFAQYKENILKSVFSVDTSAPIVYGWNEIEFGDNNVDVTTVKPKEKLAENLDIKLTNKQKEIIGKNVIKFRMNLFKNK